MTSIRLQIRHSDNEAYAVVPDPDDPVIMQVDGGLVLVRQISATMVTVLSEHLKPGRRYHFSLDLPTAQAPLDGYLDALPAEEGEPIDCRFVQLQGADLDRIHRYALMRQKQVLRSLRAGAAG